MKCNKKLFVFVDASIFARAWNDSDIDSNCSIGTDGSCG